MRLTVLGCHGPVPGSGGACSGYLIQSGETCLVCDLGSGTLSRLMSLLPLGGISAVVLSHLHFDHFSDMMALGYGIELLQKQGRYTGRLPVYAPAGPAAHRALLAAEQFDVLTITDGARVSLGALRLTFHAVCHPVETYGVSIVDPEEKRLFYTGDTGWFDGLPELAKGADCILADTAFPDDKEGAGPLPHMRVGEAMKLQKMAGAKQLLCTHLPGFGQSFETVKKRIDFAGGTVVQELGQYWI